MPIGFWSVILGAMCVISCGEKQKRSFNAFDTYLQSVSYTHLTLPTKLEV